jgi:hypothetical protein
MISSKKKKQKSAKISVKIDLFGLFSLKKLIFDNVNSVINKKETLPKQQGFSIVFLLDQILLSLIEE